MITFFTVGSHLLGPFISVVAGSSVDPEFRDHWPVNHFTSRRDGTTRFKLSAGFAGSFPKQLPSDRVSACCCISHHLPDIIRHRESIPVPLCRRRGIDRGRRVFQSFLESDQSIWLNLTCPVGQSLEQSTRSWNLLFSAQILGSSRPNLSPPSSSSRPSPRF